MNYGTPEMSDNGILIVEEPVTVEYAVRGVTAEPWINTNNDRNDEEEARKKKILRKLHGAVKDPTITEPPELPTTAEIPRRYDLI